MIKRYEFFKQTNIRDIHNEKTIRSLCSQSLIIQAFILFFLFIGCTDRAIKKTDVSDLPRISSSSFWNMHTDGPPFTEVHIVSTNLYSVRMITVNQKYREIESLDLEKVLNTRGNSRVAIWAKKDTPFANLWDVIEVCSSNNLNIYLTVNVVNAPAKEANESWSCTSFYHSQKQHLKYHSLQSVSYSTNFFIISCGKNSLSIQGKKISPNELRDLLFKHSLDFESGKLKLVVLATEGSTYQEVAKVWAILYERHLSKASLLGVQQKPDIISTNVTLRVVQSYW